MRPSAIKPANANPRQPAQRILVIDDDESVRATICENLRDYGYDVCAARNGETGLDILRVGLAPDLVITDIIMPGKGGLETIGDVRHMYPDIKIIAISGGGRTALGDFLKLAELAGCHASLPKPLDMTVLENTVRRLAS